MIPTKEELDILFSRAGVAYPVFDADEQTTTARISFQHEVDDYLAEHHIDHYDYIRASGNIISMLVEALEIVLDDLDAYRYDNGEPTPYGSFLFAPEDEVLQ